MSTERKQKIHALLKGIETGDPMSVEVINPDQYIQHNPQTLEGRDGLAALFKRLSQTSPRVNIVRIFSDGDYVFGHTEYDFSTSRIGFEVFRFEGQQTVEHWDNIQARLGPNASGHSMVDGPTEAIDLDKTEANRRLVEHFLHSILIEQAFDEMSNFVHDNYIEHNPQLTDGAASLRAHLSKDGKNDRKTIRYETVHRILAEGNFVLSVSEGYYDNQHTSFYDLFRIEASKIAEHWDTREKVAPRSEWQNDNGKF